MRKRGVIAAIALVTAVCFLMQPIAANAATLSEIRKEITEKQAELDSGRKTEQSLIARIGELQQKVDELQAAIDEEEKNLEKLEKELEEARAKVNTQTENLNGRLRNMYKTSSVGYLDVLLDSGSFSELLTNLELVKTIYSNDQEVLRELKESRKAVEEKKTEVEELQAELEESKKMTEEQMAVVEAKKAEIASDNEEMEKMLNELKGEADKLTAELQASGSSGEYAGGALGWPTPGVTYITSRYGGRYHPIYGYWSMHTGIDIGASYGSNIVSVNDGVVYKVVRGYTGYGHYIMVDHGGGYVTLYAHCSSINVSKGQYVTRGQVIGKIGSTGNSTGPHLHYEVRINGEYTNPAKYYSFLSQYW